MRTKDDENITMFEAGTHWMLDKVCKWLDANADAFRYYLRSDKPGCDTKTLIDDLRKAMEE